MNSSLFNNLNKLKEVNNKNKSKNNKKSNNNLFKNNSNMKMNNIKMNNIKMNNIKISNMNNMKMSDMNSNKSSNNSSINMNIMNNMKTSNLNQNKQNINQKNNDDLFMGVSNNIIKNNSTKPSENVLVQHINEVQEEIEEKVENSNNKSINHLNNKVRNMNFENPKTKNIVVGIINGLEKEVNTLSTEIKQFNEEKKELCDLDKKEIERLRGIIRKLYTLILTIYRSVEHKNEKSIDILEQLRASIEGNEAFLRNIDEIVSQQNKNNYKNNFLVNEVNVPNNKKTNMSLLNIMNKKNMEEEFEHLNEKPANNKKSNNITSGLMNTFGFGEAPSTKTNNSNKNIVGNSSANQVEYVEEEIANSSPNKQRKRLRAKNIAQKIESSSINNSEAKNRLNKYLL